MKEQEQFIDRFRRDVLPNLVASNIVVSIVPVAESLDLKFAIELGASVMLDKPILAVIRPGMKIPEKMARVVDRFVEFAPDDPGFNDRIMEAIREMGIVE